MFTMIIEYFRTGAARTGITHSPEIVRCRNADNTVIIQSGNFFPQIGRFIIFMIDRDQQLAYIKPVFTRDKVPRKLNGIFLEIITK